MVFLDRDLPLPDRVDILVDELLQRNLDTENLSPRLRRALAGEAVL
jgi:hypothetical protein